jgi:hypothetical protein
VAGDSHQRTEGPTEENEVPRGRKEEAQTREIGEVESREGRKKEGKIGEKEGLRGEKKAERGVEKDIGVVGRTSGGRKEKDGIKEVKELAPREGVPG